MTPLERAAKAAGITVEQARTVLLTLREEECISVEMLRAGHVESAKIGWDEIRFKPVPAPCSTVFRAMLRAAAEER